MRVTWLYFSRHLSRFNPIHYQHTMTDTNPYQQHHPDHIKQQIYSDNIRRSLAEMVERMTTLAACLPDDGDHFETSALTPQQDTAIDSIMAIEEEWILDPVIRREQSIIQWDTEE